MKPILLMILLSVILIWMNDISTIGQFTAFCTFQLFIWILMRRLS